MSESNEYLNEAHAGKYLALADSIPHRAEGEAVLLELLPRRVGRVLDLGAGDGRLIALVQSRFPDVKGLAVDFSPPMLEAARQRFAGQAAVQVVEHNLEEPLPDWGTFDAVVSSFAIHHLPDERKSALYGEIFAVLNPGGIFCNFEHVSSPTAALHEDFFRAMGMTLADEDPSNRCVDVETQLGWLRDIGFADVECFWKWRELALLAGKRPGGGQAGELRREETL